eukprot:TRINITY_DN66647_c9_g1_i1.p1 TRINITY_DN66647_c9_g1~~TRINITY_DN66647_c9_g1_i1.p1  ORF type:complete len:174 (-),score=14.46 TRINITY_DN66647_c9_g1_i1:309-830(-)
MDQLATRTIVLHVLTFLLAVMSTNYFISMLKIGWHRWVAFNACAPSIFAFMLSHYLCYFGFIKYEEVSCIAALPLIFFGGGGAVSFPWTPANNLIPQVSHVLMVACVVDLAVRLGLETFWVGLIVSALTSGWYICWVVRNTWGRPTLMNKIILNPETDATGRPVAVEFSADEW